MLLIAAEAAFGLEIGSLVTGPRRYIAPPMTAREFRHRCHETQPSVIAVDVRFGGSLWRVLDEVPRLALVRSQPKVIALAPWSGHDIETEAARLGCYDLVDLSAAEWCRDLTVAVDVARAVHRDCLDRQTRSGRVSLH